MLFCWTFTSCAVLAFNYILGNNFPIFPPFFCVFYLIILFAVYCVSIVWHGNNTANLAYWQVTEALDPICMLRQGQC
jgi:hypothetical protein